MSEPTNNNRLGRLIQTISLEVPAGIVGSAVFGLLAFFMLQGELSDLYIMARGSADVSEDVALVSIGDEALYLWNPDEPAPAEAPRELLAKLVDFLAEAEANVVVLDFLLENESDEDKSLALAAARHGTVLAATRFRISEPSSGTEFLQGLAPTLRTSIFGAFGNLQIEERTLFSDANLVRSAPLVRYVSHAAILNKKWPKGRLDEHASPGEEQIAVGLAPAAVWFHRMRLGHKESAESASSNAKAADVVESGAQLLNTIETHCSQQPLQCNDATKTLGLTDLPTPLHDPVLINFRGSESNDAIATIRAADILRILLQHDLARDAGIDMPLDIPDDIRNHLKGKIVVVGRVDAAANDRFITPYSFPALAQPDMAGARIQAQFIDQLLQGANVRRQFSGYNAIVLGLLLAIGVVVTARRWTPARHLSIWLLVCAAMIVFGVLVFRWTDGLVLDYGAAITMGILTLLCTTIWGAVGEEG